MTESKKSSTPPPKTRPVTGAKETKQAAVKPHSDAARPSLKPQGAAQQPQSAANQGSDSTKRTMVGEQRAVMPRSDRVVLVQPKSQGTGTASPPKTKGSGK